jgi:hypothetical protein
LLLLPDIKAPLFIPARSAYGFSAEVYMSSIEQLIVIVFRGTKEDVTWVNNLGTTLGQYPAWYGAAQALLMTTYIKSIVSIGTQVCFTSQADSSVIDL